MARKQKVFVVGNNSDAEKGPNPMLEKGWKVVAVHASSTSGYWLVVLEEVDAA